MGVSCEYLPGGICTEISGPTNDLLTYIQYIQELMRAGANWHLYDAQFRLDRDFSHCSWMAVRQDLELQSFCNQTRPPKQNATQTTSVKPPVGYCFAFDNKTTRCERTQFPYKHTYPRCSKHHPFFFPCCSNNNSTNNFHQ